MAISKNETLPNGVPISYWRVVSMTVVVNQQVTIEVAGYVTQQARETEQDALAEARETGEYPETDIYIETRYLVVDYDPEMSVSKAYALIKDMDEFADAEDVIDAWAAGLSYYVGDMVVYDGKQYECIQSHTSQEGQTPDVAASLWARMLNPDPEVIPVWEQPDSTNAYMTGDKVHYPDADGPIYESTIDGNVWSPEAYPQGWQLVEGGE